MYKDSIWAKEIIMKQNHEGSWGCFHTLSEPNKHPMTTEQALRRLQILGYTIDNQPIQRAVTVQFLKGWNRQLALREHYE